MRKRVWRAQDSAAGRRRRGGPAALAEISTRNERRAQSPPQRHDREGEGQEACASQPMCVPAGERFRGSPLVPRWAGLRRLGPRPAPRGRSPTAPQFPEKAQQVLFDLPIYTHPKYMRARRAFQFGTLLRLERRLSCLPEPSVTSVSTDDSGTDSHSQQQRVQGRKGRSGQVLVTGLRGDRRKSPAQLTAEPATPVSLPACAPDSAAHGLPAPSVHRPCRGARPCSRAPWSPRG